MTIDLEKIKLAWGLKQASLEKVLQKKEDRVVALIDCDFGKFVYKMTSSWKTADAVEKDTNVFEVLRNRERPYISNILKTSEGKNFASINGRLAYMYGYIKGKEPLPNMKTFEKLGYIMADIHSIEDYPYETDFDANDIIARYLIDISKNFIFVDQYLQIAKTLPDFRAFSETLIHTDISPKNSIEQEDGSLMLVDWDDAGRGPVVLDLGYMLGHFINNQLELDRESAGAFFKSYLSKREISSHDKNGIFDGCLLFHLMYIIFGNNLEERWKKIQWLADNRKMVETLIP